jgi:hypothetical protein
MEGKKERKKERKKEKEDIVRAHLHVKSITPAARIATTICTSNPYRNQIIKGKGEVIISSIR